MFDRILPKKLDNTFHGHRLALWLFGVVLLVKAMQSVSVLLNGFEIIKKADGIPIDTYTADSARTLVAIFAAMAISRLLITLICAVALVRYRSALIFLIALLVIHDGVRELILYYIRIGRPIGVFVNAGMILVMLVGLALSAQPAAKSA